MRKACVDFAARVDGTGRAHPEGSYIKIMAIEDETDEVHAFQVSLPQAEALARDILSAIDSA